MGIKKLIVTASLVVLSLAAYADSVTEANESLDSAKAFLADKNYTKAVEEINFALNKVNEILAEKLNSYLPQAPKGYIQNSENTKGGAMALFGMQGTLTASSEYNEDKPEPVPTDEGEYVEDTRGKVTISIAVGGILGKAGAFANMGQMSAGDNNTKSIRIKGYTGTVTYNKNDKRGTLILQLGEKATITAEGNNIPNSDILKTLVESVKLSELEKGF